MNTMLYCYNNELLEIIFDGMQQPVWHNTHASADE